ncbi:MAG: DUF1232 domain-containing protein [Candidatus Cloacimonetes bacterium]|nr:DUF1232 domain-containing protein [Candidatus Cloacimonadota bacterium]
MSEEIVFENGEQIKKRFQFYERLRKKFSKYSHAKLGEDKGKITEYLFAIPDFFMLLLRLSMEKRVATKQKLMIGGIIAYVISPIDLIPDFIPLFGYVDDLVLIVYGLNIVLNEIDHNIVLDNWSGEEDVLELISRITAVSEEFLDKNLLKKIRNIINKMKR